MRPRGPVLRLLAGAGALALLVTATGGLAASRTGSAAAQEDTGAVQRDTPPPIADDQLVLAQLDPGGLPTDVTIVTRVSATDLPEQTVRVPTSTTQLRYLDRPGSPPISGDAMLVPLGGSGESAVVTSAAFGRPLPVALHAQYRDADGAVAPDDIPGRSGELTVRYTVTNTVVSEQTIRYTDAAGTTRTRTDPVFAPFVGSLAVTLPAGTRLVAAPGATIATTDDGAARVRWDLVLYPPIGSYQTVVSLRIAGDDLRIPPLRMEVVPAGTDEDPSVAFTADLLDRNVSGSEDLAEGLTEIDEATLQLAAGAADLTAGLRTLQEGTGALDAAVSGQLVPGAATLARATDRLATGQTQLAGGVAAAYTGATDLAQGTSALATALAQLDRGLDALAGRRGLPQARDAARQLAVATDRLAAAVGSPEDPTPSWTPASGDPPPDNLTLVQTARAMSAGAEALTGAAAALGQDIADVARAAGGIATTAAEAAGDAGEAARLVGGVLAASCAGPPPGLGPAQCQALQSAVTAAGDAAAGAGDAARDAGVLATDLVDLAVRAEAVAVTAGALARGCQALANALAEVGGALRSRDDADPGLYEGLRTLTDGLRAASGAALALADGAEQSLAGARRLDGGAEDLSEGLGAAAGGAAELAEGGQALADGASQQADGTREVAGAVGQVDEGVSAASEGGAALTDGARQLRRDGTTPVLEGVVDSSRQTARADAYLRETSAAALTAAPYDPPDGGAARVAYVFAMDPPEPVTGPGLVGLGIAAVVLISLLVLAGRRLAGDPPGR